MDRVRVVNRPVLIIANALSGGGAEAVAHLMVAQINNGACVLFENNAGVTVPGKKIKAAYRQYCAGAFFTVLVNLWRLAIIQWEKIRLQPEVTISHLEGPNFANLLTVRGGRKVVFVHNRLTQSYPGNGIRDKIMRYLCRKLYLRADCIVAVSSGIKQELIESLRADSSKVIVLPNPVDIKAVKSAANSRYEDYRDALSRKRYIISVASLTHQKNHSHMLRIYAQFDFCSKHSGSVKLVLLGDGPLRYELQSLCRELNLSFFDAQDNCSFDPETQVYFLGFQENPYPLIAQAEILLMTSHWEGMPISLLEAMALGIPAVASDCSEGIRDLWQLPTSSVEHSTSPGVMPTPYGVLIPLGETDGADVALWAKEIEKIMDDSEKQKRIAQASQDRAGLYGIDCVVQMWNNSILQSPRY